MKRIVGPKGEKPGAGLVTELVQLFADGRAPRGLRRYYGGAQGHALDKEGKERGLDARPACAGEFWRRLVCKSLYLTEARTLRDYLEPAGQMCVGTPGGVEALPHAARQWMKRHAADVDRVHNGVAYHWSEELDADDSDELDAVDSEELDADDFDAADLDYFFP